MVGEQKAQLDAIYHEAGLSGTLFIPKRKSLVTSYFGHKFKISTKVLAIPIILIILSHTATAIAQPRTEYNALFTDYLSYETNNFTSGDKIYIYGSTRSSRWYKHEKGEGKKMFEISTDLDAHCAQFSNFNYIILEKEEVLRYSDNRLYEFVNINKELFEESEKYGFLIYKKISTQPTQNLCN